MLFLAKGTHRPPYGGTSDWHDRMSSVSSSERRYGLVAVDFWWHGCPGNPVQNCTPTLTDSCFLYGLWCRSSGFRVQVSSVFEFD